MGIVKNSQILQVFTRYGTDPGRFSLRIIIWSVEDFTKK